jgi:hypothetical protein
MTFGAAGRAALARHAWREAFDNLTAAQASEPGDLAALGEAAWWLSRVDDAIVARQRAYAWYLQANQRGRAALIACSPGRPTRAALILKVVRGQLGHSTPTMTMHYIPADLHAMRDVVRPWGRTASRTTVGRAHRKFRWGTREVRRLKTYYRMWLCARRVCRAHVYPSAVGQA